MNKGVKGVKGVKDTTKKYKRSYKSFKNNFYSYKNLNGIFNKLYADGFYNKIRCGFVVLNDKNEVLNYKEYPPGSYTINELEYMGIISACELSKNKDYILTDSKLVVGHSVMNWRQNFEHLKPLTKRVQQLLTDKKLNLVWCPRELNVAGIYIDYSFKKNIKEDIKKNY